MGSAWAEGLARTQTETASQPETLPKSLFEENAEKTPAAAATAAPAEDAVAHRISRSPGV